MSSGQRNSVTMRDLSKEEQSRFDLTTEIGRYQLAKQIKQDVNDWCEQAYAEPWREHLGASKMGSDCDRYLWYHFRWMHKERFDGRMHRLFQRGHWQEAHFITWLRGIGFTVMPLDANGKQYKVSANEKHFGGSLDSIGIPGLRYAIDKPLLLEFKTKGTGKGYNELSENGVQLAQHDHYVQMCCYGYLHKLEYALYFNINKNDDDIYVEVVALDGNVGKHAVERAAKIIQSQTAPPRISDSPAFYKCKACKMIGICHFKNDIEPNCRSCVNAVPIENAEWRCNYYQATIPKDFIVKGCENWQPLEH